MSRIGFEEASKIFGVSYKHFRNKYKDYGVPYYKIGKKVEFSEHELYGFIESKCHFMPEDEAEE